MKSEVNAIVKQLINFVKEQKEMNREQKGINHRLENFVKEQHALNVHAEKRFQAFYRMIISMQK